MSSRYLYRTLQRHQEYEPRETLGKTPTKILELKGCGAIKMLVNKNLNLCPGLGLKILEWGILQKASIGGSERKKWINLVQMASIGKPMKLRPQLDFEAKYQ